MRAVAAIPLADGFWAGAGGAIIGAFVGAVVGLLGGFLIEVWRNKRKERNERQRAAQELVGSARAITAAFRNAASALRVASRSNGSLEGWADDDRRLQESLDGIRRDASGDLWAQIERFDTILKRLREEQREKHEMPSKEAGELSQGFEGVADAVNAAYPKSRSGER